MKSERNFRYWHVLVKKLLFAFSLFYKQSVSAVDETQWEGFGEIKLPMSVEIVRLDILPSASRKKAMLQSVRVVVCCQTGARFHTLQIYII